MPICYDARWVGNYGIARYATESSKNFPSEFLRPLHAKFSPLSPLGLAEWELNNLPRKLKKEYYYSPSFTPSLSHGHKQTITVHDLIHLDVPGESSKIKKTYYENVVKKVIQNSDLTFTVSRYSQERIAEWANIDLQRIVITGNSASAIFSPSGDKYQIGNPYILYVGNTKPHKNSESALNILRAIPGNVSLLMVSSKTSELMAKISEMKLEGRVRILEDVSEESLAKIYRGARLLLMPSYYEGFGLPVLEAMASGIPVVASNTTSLQEIIADAGLMFNPSDSEEGADLVNQLLDDSPIRDALIFKGLTRSLDYQWENISNTIYSHLIQVCNQTQ